MHAHMQRRMRRLPWSARIVLVLASLMSFVTYSYVGHYAFFKNHTAEDSYLEIEKCPLCYGTSLCEDLRNNKATYQSTSRLQFLNSLANLKNVNYGEYRGYPVVFKKLAHSSELSAFDAKFEKDTGFPGVSHTKNLKTSEVTGISDIMACPSDRLLDTMLLRYREKIDAVDLRYPEKLHLLTTLHINPEPIILQTFPREKGWPFPKYFGACGRFVVVENAGTSLGELYNAPWEERAKYAYQIFAMAEKLTHNSDQFSLYLTDVQYDNFAVDEKGIVTIIDAENIVVVDKWKLERERTQEWDQPLYHAFDECPNYGTCITIHKELLCSRFTADFNYYAVCRNLLSSYGTDYGRPGGLLHNTPEDVEETHSLSRMLEQCAKPDVPKGRLNVKVKLLSTLKQLAGA